MSWHAMLMAGQSPTLRYQHMPSFPPSIAPSLPPFIASSFPPSIAPSSLPPSFLLYHHIYHFLPPIICISIQWLHPNGSLVVTGNTYTNPSASLSDSGVYTCRAVNGYNDTEYHPVVVEGICFGSEQAVNGQTRGVYITLRTSCSMNVRL